MIDLKEKRLKRLEELVEKQNQNVVWWDFNKSDISVGEDYCVRYQFVILNNDRRTSENIKKRIYNYLENVVGYTKKGYVLRSKRGEKYSILSLEINSLKGPKNEFPWNIYLKGKVKRDSRLCNFQNAETLENYILKKAEKLLK